MEISPNSSHGGVVCSLCRGTSRWLWAVVLLDCVWEGKVDARAASVAALPPSWVVPAFLAGCCPDFSAALPVALPFMLAAIVLIFPVDSLFVAALLGRFIVGVALLLKKWRGPCFQFFFDAAMLAMIVLEKQRVLFGVLIVLMDKFEQMKERFFVVLKDGAEDVIECSLVLLDKSE